VDLFTSLGPKPGLKVQESPTMAPSLRVFLVLALGSSMLANFTTESAL
jgi:hypothetical protein